MDFEKWLSNQLEKITDEAIVAFNFNLYEEEDEGSFSAQLVGCPHFDEANEDWACRVVFSSGEDLFGFRSNDWEDALNEFIEELKRYIKNNPNSELQKNKRRIAVGFVDGDLEIVV